MRIHWGYVSDISIREMLYRAERVARNGDRVLARKMIASAAWVWLYSHYGIVVPVPEIIRRLDYIYTLRASGK